MIEALICVHTSMDYNDWKCCFAGVSECLCLQSTYRLAVDVVLRSVGCSHDPTRGECCKCGVYCCDCALIQPRVCCGAARQTRCMRGAGSTRIHEQAGVRPVLCELHAQVRLLRAAAKEPGLGEHLCGKPSHV